MSTGLAGLTVLSREAIAEALEQLRCDLEHVEVRVVLATPGEDGRHDERGFRLFRRPFPYRVAGGDPPRHGNRYEQVTSTPEQREPQGVVGRLPDLAASHRVSMEEGHDVEDEEDAADQC